MNSLQITAELPKELTANRYSLFLGCIAKNVYPGIEKATRMVFQEIGIELVDHRYSCCPAPGAIRSYDNDTWLVIGVRNLIQAEKDNINIMPICNGCYGSLAGSNEVFHQNEERRKFVNEQLKIIGEEYKGSAEVIHFLDILYANKDKIKAKKKFDLGFKVAVHYGCHYLKPTSHTKYFKEVKNPENPKIFEEIVKLLGCEVVKFKEYLTCCGAGGGVWSGKEELALEVVREKLQNIQNVKADLIVNTCPFCHLHFDQAQKKLGNFEIPVLHLTQLIGLSFGIKDKLLGLHIHLTSTREIVKKVKELKKGEE